MIHHTLHDIPSYIIYDIPIIFFIWSKFLHYKFSFMIQRKSVPFFSPVPRSARSDGFSQFPCSAARHLLLQSHLNSFPRFDVIRQHHLVVLAVVPCSRIRTENIRGKHRKKMVDLRSEKWISLWWWIFHQWFRMIQDGSLWFPTGRQGTARSEHHQEQSREALRARCGWVDLPARKAQEVHWWTEELLDWRVGYS